MQRNKREAAMKRMAFTLALVLALGIGVEGIGVRILYAQQESDPRVADLIRAGKVRVGLGLGTPVMAVKDPVTGEVRGLALDLARALAARIGIELQSVLYPRPGAIMEGLRTNAWDVSFLIIDPTRTAEVDFSPPQSATSRMRTSPGFASQPRAGTRRTFI